MRSSVDARAYEGACVDLVSKFKALRSVTRESVPDLERFFATYVAAAVPKRRRLELGGVRGGTPRVDGERDGRGS